MKKGIMLVVLAACTISLIAFSGCKKEGKTDAHKAPGEHMKEMVQRSFEESKKVIAVKVNGEPVTMFALLREMNVIGPQYLASGAKKSDELDRKVRADALRNVIFQTLAVQEAKKRGLQVKPEVLDQNVKKAKEGFGSDEAYRKYLAETGMTEEDFRKIVEQDTLFEMIAAQEVDAKISVPEAAVRQRYNKEKASLPKDSSHKQITYEAAKGMIEQKLKAEAGEKRMRAWEQELRKNAKVEIVDKKLETAAADKPQK
jgi:hypothetical protein